MQQKIGTVSLRPPGHSLPSPPLPSKGAWEVTSGQLQGRMEKYSEVLHVASEWKCHSLGFDFFYLGRKKSICKV